MSVMYWLYYAGIAQVSALGSSETSAPQRFKCISIMVDSNGGSETVRSRGGVLSREGPFSEVPLYRDGVKSKEDKIGMACGAHISELIYA